MWFRDKREKELRLCNIQRNDDAVTSQTPLLLLILAMPYVRLHHIINQLKVHCRIMECMRDYKSKEETVKHLLDQYRITHESTNTFWDRLDKDFKITSVYLTMKLLLHLFLLLRIIYEQAVTRSVKAEHQDAFQILLPSDVGKSEDISGGRVVIKISYFGFHVPTFMTSVMRHAV
ncbi:hypothetical protein IGI04_021350 [Brassica rapa subsp. trilocularis]|uniref:Uncharacterized protein n=1 Tax=Brassica rapa subsp. trilocularis TaxID=1813537 RepID=A0ABQ7LXV4_BRACM|nr:hypothetical protein IGI04_021350 [Brassica rapa subsp. trilocularis]